MGCQVTKRNISDIRLDIVLNSMAVIRVIRIAPVLQAVELNIFIQQFCDCDKLLRGFLAFIGCRFRRMKLTDRFLIFNLSNTEIGSFIRGKALCNDFCVTGAAVIDFPLLTLFSGFHIKYSFVVYSKLHDLL